MAGLILRRTRRTRRWRFGFLILATIVILAAAGYGEALNNGWPT
jgi:hypothetical protein